MTRFSNAVVCATGLALASPASSAPPPLFDVEIRTPLHGVVAGDSLRVRVVEAHPRAPAFRVYVSFFSDRNEQVGTVSSAEVKPGEPATFQVGHAQLRANDPYAAVRAVVQLSRQGNGERNEPYINMEIFNERALTLRGAGFCGPASPLPGRLEGRQGGRQSGPVRHSGEGRQSGPFEEPGGEQSGPPHEDPKGGRLFCEGVIVQLPDGTAGSPRDED